VVFILLFRKFEYKKKRNRLSVWLSRLKAVSVSKGIDSQGGLPVRRLSLVPIILTTGCLINQQQTKMRTMPCTTSGLQRRIFEHLLLIVFLVSVVAFVIRRPPCEGSVMFHRK